MRRVAPFVLLAVLLSGCSSPRVFVRMHNLGTQSVREVELNYGQMFGTGVLQPGEMRERNVKLSDAADVSIRFYDATNQLHISKGPHVAPGETGYVEARIQDGGRVQWNVSLTAR